MIMCRALSYEENTLDKSRLKRRFWNGTAGSMELPLIDIMTRTTGIPVQTSTVPDFNVCLPI